jgi:hypothetical protein
MADIDARRFRVLGDAFYVRQDDGVWLRNNLGSFSIQGEDAYRLVDVLIANLDEGRTIGEITEGLPPAAADSVLRLVASLERNGFVKRAEHPAEPVPDWMRDRYPAHLAFLERHGDRAVSRLLNVRTSLVVCAGDGVALRAVLGALGEFGVAKVLVLTTEAGAGEIADVADRARRHDPNLRWRVEVCADPFELGDRPEIAQAAQVVLTTDSADPGPVARRQQALRGRGVPVGALLRCADYVLAVPPGTDTSWCPGCLHRWVARPVNGDPADLPPAAAPATIAALHLVQHTFVQLAGVALSGGDRAVTVEPLAPVVRTHPGRRHPACPWHDPLPSAGPAVDHTALGAARVRPDVPASYDAPELVAANDRIVAAGSAWQDQVTGPLLTLGEDDLDQLPLSGSSCVVAAPHSTADTPVVRRFVCRALSAREARNQVVLFALEWLAPGRPGSVGAGWTLGEAWYRAQAALSLSLPAGPADWRPAGGPASEFLTETLAAAGRAWRATSTEQLPTGFTRATVLLSGDHTVAGVGVDERHALDNALLAAAVRSGPDGADACCAHLGPPVDTWSAAVDLVVKQASHVDVVDVSGTLPFLDGDAMVLHARPPGASV